MKRLYVHLLLAACAALAQAQPTVQTGGDTLQGPDSRGLYGGGRGIRVIDLEPSRLRTGLEALPAKSQRKALSVLEGLQFHRNDLEALRVDRKGGVFYACAFHDHASPSSTSSPRNGDESPERMAPVPISSPPALSSRPGLLNTIYLDFNGHVITGTVWNSGSGIARWDCRPFDTDGNETTFSDLEQRYITEMWQRVAEDFSPFDVNVTTIEPASWNRWTAHALITPATDAAGRSCPHNGYGGIAYVDVFGSLNFSYDSADGFSPAWVLPMSGDSYANTAEAISHEVGHNLGLSHDGTASQAYYGGHDATATAPSWGPIMGTGYGRDVSQWSKGEYYQSNQSQDDLAIISDKLAYRPDDHGNTAPAATPIPAFTSSIRMTGVIERTDDVDVFRITSGTGPLTIGAKPTRVANGTWGGNVDLALLLYDASGALVASNNPAGAVTSGLSVALSAGQYTLHAVPVDAGLPLGITPSGYTRYGSLGVYELTGTFTVASGGVYVLAPNGGETIYRATGSIVRWSSGFTNPVDLNLYYSGLFHSSIAGGIPNVGEYHWAVPAALGVGAGYRIRISRTGMATNYDESDADFSIAAPVFDLIRESFDASTSLPPGWTQQVQSGSATWVVQAGGWTGGINPANAYSPPYNVTLALGDTGDNRTRLQTPGFDLTGASNATLRFRHHMGYWEPDQDLLEIRYRTTPSGSWTLLNTYATNVPSWTLRELAIPVAGGFCQLAFEGIARYGYGVCLDDIVVSAQPIIQAVPDLDVDQLPDRWEQIHFGGATNAQPNTTAANGLNTLLEAYIAGLDPLQSTAFFRLNVTNTPAGLVFDWQPSLSGRLYSISRATNLPSGFAPFTPSLPWFPAIYTSSTPPTADTQYRIDVRME